jgi:transglutaminase-like putative cysteine protease
MRASPTRVGKFFPILLAFLAATSASALAEPIWIDVDSTPYDRQMTRVRPVLASVAGETPETIPLAIVNQWMSRIRRLHYRYSREWQTPSEVMSSKTGDCKGKALAMYEVMQLIGATNVRFIIGKHHASDWFTHAWVQWDTPNGSFVLDPTFNRRPVRAEQNPTRYIPLYAYEGMLRYRAVNTILVAEKPLRAVASGNLY